MTNGRLTAGASSLRKLAREIYRAAVDTVLAQARARARRSAQYTDPESAILSSTGPDRNYSRAEIVMSTTPCSPCASTSPMNYYPGRFSSFLVPHRREITAATAFHT